MFCWYWMQWNMQYPNVNRTTYSGATNFPCTECSETGNLLIWTGQHTLKSQTVNVLPILNAVKQEISWHELDNILWSHKQSMFYLYWMQWNRGYHNVHWTPKFNSHYQLRAIEKKQTTNGHWRVFKQRRQRDDKWPCLFLCLLKMDTILYGQRLTWPVGPLWRS